MTRNDSSYSFLSIETDQNYGKDAMLSAIEIFDEYLRDGAKSSVPLDESHK